MRQGSPQPPTPPVALQELRRTARARASTCDLCDGRRDLRLRQGITVCVHCRLIEERR